MLKIFKKNKAVKLTEGNILKNLMILSFPIMFSNFFQTFYNLTDAFFLGKLDENARNAVSVAGLTFPLVMFIASFGAGFMVGGVALISHSKGRGESEKIKKLLGQFIFLLSVFSLFFISAKVIFIRKLLLFLNTPPEIFDSALSYIGIIMNGMIFMFVFLLYQSFAHGMGDTLTPMKIQIVSVGVNIILDPVLILGLSGFQKYGVKGAAVATFIARIIAALFAVIYFIKDYREYLPELKDLIPEKNLIKQIFDISIPASFAQSASGFGFLILQGFINSYGTVAISVYSVSERITNVYMLPAIGISGALTTLIGQNLGAGKPERAEKSFAITLKAVFIVMFSGCVVLFLAGEQITKFFINDPEVVAAGKRILQLDAVASLIYCILSVFNGVFNGSGHTKPAMLFNIARLWIFRIPAVYILSGYALNFSFAQNIPFFYDFVAFVSEPLKKYPYDSFWWAMIFSNILTLIWAYFIFSKGDWKKLKYTGK
ncbi:MAG: hypothetical protein CSB55_01375 [Candidatus Cloacimonadota bacterium]|nr:MAG: hypothetical protein CSB55_01375 [Candidatus Cloacimonadota bacterium]